MRCGLRQLQVLFAGLREPSGWPCSQNALTLPPKWREEVAARDRFLSRLARLRKRASWAQVLALLERSPVRVRSSINVRARAAFGRPSAGRSVRRVISISDADRSDARDLVQSRGQPPDRPRAADFD
jgi:hypothetical protein